MVDQSTEDHTLVIVFSTVKYYSDIMDDGKRIQERGSLIAHDNNGHIWTPIRGDQHKFRTLDVVTRGQAS